MKIKSANLLVFIAFVGAACLFPAPSYGAQGTTKGRAQQRRERAMGLDAAERAAQAARRAERILAYASDITVNSDGSLAVREIITVHCAAEQIKRGIYRDFPTRYHDQFGNKYVVDFEVTEVLRDGRPEPYHLEDVSNGTRVYIGAQNVFLEPGDYTYTFTYTANRELGFFKDHDELYWNVTGNGWAFPIEAASATVHLPPGVPRQSIALDGYTGFQGARGKDFKALVEEDQSITFRCSRPLDPSEGLTLVVSWSKGYVAEPTTRDKLSYFLGDNRTTAVAMGGLLLLLLYYFAVWLKVGQDPAQGVIMPLYEPPEGISPAAVRFVNRMGFDYQTFAAAILNMAVKKYLTISEEDGVYTLARAQGDKNLLSAEEKLIASRLLDPEQSIRLTNTNHREIAAALKALKSSLEVNLEKVNFLANSQYLVPGLIGSILVVILTAVSAGGMKTFMSGFLLVWLSIWTLGVVFLVKNAVNLWRSALGGHKGAAFGAAIFTSLFALPFLAGELFGLSAFAIATSPATLLVLIVIALLNYLFHHLLKAPTHAGRRLMDRIEGFKLYLGTTDKDRLQTLYPVEKTPEHFEKYLPYALALDVEQAWAEKFSDVLGRAGEPGATYSPSWYSGSSWASMGAGGFASSLGSSFSTAIASSSTAPGSSSGGGGGGSSGGGGGGGGGGGW